jgi:hypothetical protein
VADAHLVACDLFLIAPSRAETLLRLRVFLVGEGAGRRKPGATRIGRALERRADQ